MALSRAVSEIFNVEKCRDLEIRVRSHSRSLKVVPFGTSCMVFRLDALAFSPGAEWGPGCNHMSPNFDS